MSHFLKALCFLLIAVSLTACGGGGGSSGGSGGTPAPVVTDTLRLSTGAITASATQFEDVPGDVSVRATVTGNNTAGIAFGTLPGVDSLPSWLTVELGTFAGNSIDAVFRFPTTDLPPGTYQFTVRAVSFDANENALDTADILITYEIAEGVPISVSPKNIDLVMHYGSDPIDQTVSVTAGNYSWSAFSSDANLDVDSGVGSQDITLSIFPPFREIVDENGQYQGLVDVSQTNYSNSDQIFLNLTVFETLDVFDPEIFVNAISGTSTNHEVGVNLRGNGLEWAATTTESWVSFSATSGTISTEDDISDSPDGDDFSVFINAASLNEGRHEATVTVTAAADQSLDIQVIVDVAAQKLRPSRRGIALSQSPAGSNLQSSVAIESNTGGPANWTAVSNAIWLSVTASGSTNDSLTATVDPASLPSETVSFATISLTSPDAAITGTEQIEVGFWKSEQVSVDGPVSIGGMNSEVEIVSDPVRPYVYINPSENVLDIYNLFSGSLINSIDIGAPFEHFTVSDDGAFLYISRSGEDVGFIDVIDLTAQAVSETWTFDVDRALERDRPNIAFTRISGAPYLITTSQKIVYAQTGEVVADFQLGSGQFALNVLDARNETLCFADNDVACSKLTSAGFEGARVTSELSGEESLFGGISSLQVTPDGTKLYVPDSRIVTIFGTSDVETQGTLTDGTEFVESLNLTPSGQLYVTSLNDDDIANEIRSVTIFSSVNDSEIRKVQYPSQNGGVVPPLNDVEISADERRLIFISDDGFLEMNFLSLD